MMDNEIKFDITAEEIENSIIEFRKKLIAAAAEEYGISMEEMTHIADNISNGERQDVRHTLSDCKNSWPEFAVEGNEIDMK